MGEVVRLNIKHQERDFDEELALTFIASVRKGGGSLEPDQVKEILATIAKMRAECEQLQRYLPPLTFVMPAGLTEDQRKRVSATVSKAATDMSQGLWMIVIRERTVAEAFRLAGLDY